MYCKQNSRHHSIPTTHSTSEWMMMLLLLLCLLLLWCWRMLHPSHIPNHNTSLNGWLMLHLSLLSDLSFCCGSGIALHPTWLWLYFIFCRLLHACTVVARRLLKAQCHAAITDAIHRIHGGPLVHLLVSLVIIVDGDAVVVEDSHLHCRQQQQQQRKRRVIVVKLLIVRAKSARPNNVGPLHSRPQPWCRGSLHSKNHYSLASQTIRWGVRLMRRSSNKCSTALY